MMRRKTPEQLRSHRWFGVDDLRAFGHRSRLLQMGLAEQDFRSKPVIGIINTWSELSPCHAHIRTRAEEVKRGVWQAGGFPVELLTHPVTEQYQKPSSMLYRNMLAMKIEQLARRQAAWVAPARRYTRGWTSLYLDHVGQADEGCDMDFLQAGAATPEIH